MLPQAEPPAWWPERHSRPPLSTPAPTPPPACVQTPTQPGPPLALHRRARVLHPLMPAASSGSNETFPSCLGLDRAQWDPQWVTGQFSARAKEERRALCPSLHPHIP